MILYIFIFVPNYAVCWVLFRSIFHALPAVLAATLIMMICPRHSEVINLCKRQTISRLYVYKAYMPPPLTMPIPQYTIALIASECHHIYG